MDLYRSKHSDKKYPNRNSSGDDRPSRSFRNSRDDRGSRYSRDNDRQDTTVTCSDCNVECTVPFVPRNDKPVYCSDCFRKYKPDDSGDDRPSRDDRGSRIQETTEVQEIQEIILDQVEEKVINF